MAEKIEVTCGSCNRKIQANAKYAGLKVKCPGCEHPLVVPLVNKPVVNISPSKKKEIALSDKNKEDGSENKHAVIVGLLSFIVGVFFASGLLYAYMYSNHKQDSIRQGKLSETQEKLEETKSKLSEALALVQSQSDSANKFRVDLEKATIEVQENLDRNKSISYMIAAEQIADLLVPEHTPQRVTIGTLSETQAMLLRFALLRIGLGKGEQYDVDMINKLTDGWLAPFVIAFVDGNAPIPKEDWVEEMDPNGNLRNWPQIAKEVLESIDSP